jgi:hypothetical protein
LEEIHEEDLAPVRSSESSSRRMPMKSVSDGVFANLSAKPELADVKSPPPPIEELPPSYDQVAADPTPAYFDDTLWTTQTDDGEILIEGLPLGSFVSFLLSAMVSLSFHFIGFMMAFIFTTSHAGRAGAKAGYVDPLFLCRGSKPVWLSKFKFSCGKLLCN